jgi:hypothetical protein
VIDVRLDAKAKTATLLASVQHPDGLIANSQGNSQRLPGGHLFVGWGNVGRFSEFDATGNLLWDGQVPSGYDTYRAYRSDWTGDPDTDPTAIADAPAPIGSACRRSGTAPRRSPAGRRSRAASGGA